MNTDHNPEDIIEKIGGCGRYQVFLSIVSHLMKWPTVITMYLMVYSVATPKWWCADESDGSADDQRYNSVYNISQLVGSGVTDINEMNDSLIHYKTNNNTYDGLKNCMNRNRTTCRNIAYDGAMKTVIEEWSMVCTLSWVPSTIASIQMLGILCGNLISGQLADMFGRKAPWIGSLILLAVANLTGYFSTTWLMFGVARALCGIGMGTFLTVQYSLSTEVTLARWRPWVVAFPTWSTLACVFALISILIPDWRKLHLLSALSTIPFLMLWLIVPESFRWHLSHDRTRVAKDIIQRIGRFNKHKLSDDTVMSLLHASINDANSGDKRKYTVVNLFRTKALAKMTCLSGINWLALGLLSYGIQYGIQALSGNFFFNMFLFNVIGIPVSLIGIFLSNAIGRCKTAALAYAIATIGCFIVGVVQYIDLNPKLRGSLTNGFAMFANVGIGVAWGPVQIMTLELYPTVVRNIGYGFLNTFARLGAVIGPQLAYLDTRVPGVMYFVCCGVSICCVISTLLLSETKGAALDDKIQQAKHNSNNVDILL